MSASYSPQDYARLLSEIPEGCIYVDGAYVRTTDRHEVFGKADGRLITLCGYASPDDLNAAVSAAKTAAPGWAAKAPAERSKVLQAIARALESRFKEFVALESHHGGKTMLTRKSTSVRP